MAVGGKLVRNRIPDIIRGNGEIPVVRTLSREEFIKALLDKLVEEAEELRRAPPAERVEELADIREVLSALHNELRLPVRLVERVRKKKKHSRGGFDRRLFLESEAKS